MPTPPLDLAELKRRMQGAAQAFRHELGGLRTGRASASLIEPVTVDAYGGQMPINQVATISVPEPRMLSVQVWDKSLVTAVDKAIRNANLGLSPTIEGQILRIRIPELNEQRRKEMVKYKGFSIADLLETPERKFVLACVWGLLTAIGIVNLWQLARITTIAS